MILDHLALEKVLGRKRMRHRLFKAEPQVLLHAIGMLSRGAGYELVSSELKRKFGFLISKSSVERFWRRMLAVL